MSYVIKSNATDNYWAGEAGGCWATKQSKALLYCSASAAHASAYVEDLSDYRVVYVKPKGDDGRAPWADHVATQPAAPSGYYIRDYDSSQFLESFTINASGINAKFTPYPIDALYFLDDQDAQTFADYLFDMGYYDLEVTSDA